MNWFMPWELSYPDYLVSKLMRYVGRGDSQSGFFPIKSWSGGGSDLTASVSSKNMTFIESLAWISHYCTSEMTYSPICITETLDLGLELCKDWRRQGFLGFSHTDVPKFLMFGTEKNNCATRLDTEGWWSMFDGVVDTHFDAVVSDWGRFCKSEDGTAHFDGVEEGSLVGHFWWFVVDRLGGEVSMNVLSIEDDCCQGRRRWWFWMRRKDEQANPSGIYINSQHWQWPGDRT